MVTTTELLTPHAARRKRALHRQVEQLVLGDTASKLTELGEQEVPLWTMEPNALTIHVRSQLSPGRCPHKVPTVPSPELGMGDRVSDQGSHTTWHLGISPELAL